MNKFHVFFLIQLLLFESVYLVSIFIFLQKFYFKLLSYILIIILFNKKMKYIIFSKFNRYHFLFITYFITVIIKEIIYDLYRSTNDIIESLNKYFSCSISDLLSIIPIIIIKIRSKSVLKRENSFVKEKMLENLKLKYTNTYKIDPNKKLRRIIKLEIIVSIFDFLGKY